MKINLPEKRYYSIGEVAKAFGVNTSLLRYWEKEFKQIHEIPLPFEGVFHQGIKRILHDIPYFSMYVHNYRVKKTSCMVS